METDSPIERPLSRSAKATLMCAAGATILLYYLLALLCVLILSVIVLFELAILLVLLRFGLAGMMAGPVEAHTRLIVLFFTSSWLKKGKEFHVPLLPADAPGLFVILKKLCARLQVAEPRAVSLTMDVNAFVRLKGYRRGAGKTILGIGYDLIAGLSEPEIEAVLAHEMVHAKLIQRGFKSWVWGGHIRVTRLTGMLDGWTEAYHRAGRSFRLAEFLLRGAHALNRLTARLVAKYSRQDEFEADHGAAEICGSAPLRSSLLKLESLEKIASRLSWQERVAHLELSGGFGQWLVNELAQAQFSPASETSRDLFNKYATHPLLRDRLAALPPPAAALPAGLPSALSLLADPDKVAEKLVTEIQRTAAAGEQKDTRELNSWLRKAQRAKNARPLEMAGLLIIIFGILIILGVLIANGWSLAVILALPAVIAVGTALRRLGRFRDRLQLPIPDFAALKQAWQNIKDLKLAEPVEKQLEIELKALAEKEPKPAKRAAIFAAESYSALGRCDYLRAYVAARLCLNNETTSVEGMLAFAIASAALKKFDQAVRSVNQAQHASGFRTPSTLWGAAWALMLLGDWEHAEAFLEETIRSHAFEPNLLTLQALCQSRRGKLQSAILRSRRACLSEFCNREHTKFLIDLLLNGGYLREAREKLLPLEPHARTDTELAFSMVRLQIMQQNFAAAEEWIAVLRQNAIQPRRLVRLGQVYETARKPDQAIACYQEALAAGYYPEAHLGLGRIEADRHNKAGARQEFLRALDLDRPLGDGAQGPLPLFNDVIEQLLGLQEPALDCRAWIATFTRNVAIAPLANQSFVIFAPARENAEQYVHAILGALQPGKPPILPGAICWQEAPHQRQPDGPVRPGVQCIFG